MITVSIYILNSASCKFNKLKKEGNKFLKCTLRLFLSSLSFPHHSREEFSFVFPP